jgi:microcin C transport system substrate-binding protein
VCGVHAQRDRNLLRRADDLLRAAGCKRDNNRLLLPDGTPFEVEFLDSSGALKPHTEPLQANLRKLGIASTFRTVDAAQYKRRLDNFDFDIVTMALGGSFTPGDGLRITWSSEAAKTPGTRNVAGVESKAVDFLIDKISRADTRDELNVACRALDRVLRAGRYWIPMWYKDKSLIAYWDVFFCVKVPSLIPALPLYWYGKDLPVSREGLSLLSSRHHFQILRCLMCL